MSSKAKKSGHSLRNSARKLSATPSLINQGTRDNLREAMPKTTEILDNTRGRERGFDAKPFDDALDKESPTERKEAYAKALGDVPRKSAKAAANNFKKVGSLAKNKKYFIAGGSLLGLLIPIIAFFLWMSLFKSVHIKNLYVSYRWAQFNRGLNQALKSQIDYAKANAEARPAGTADTVVSPTDPVEKISADTNSDFDPNTVDPDIESERVSSVDKSVAEGSYAEVAADAGVDGKVAAIEADGDTPEERAQSETDSARANAEADLSGEGLAIDDPPATIKEGVDEAKAQREAGKTPTQAISEGVNKVLGTKAFAKASDIVFATTMYCIFRDVYKSARDQLVKIPMVGALATFQAEAKVADCQKLGKCDANQIGAMNERFDNGEESYTEACGAARAEQTSKPGCVEIDPKFVVDGLAQEVGGAGGFALNSMDELLDPPDVKVELGPLKVNLTSETFIDQGCSLVMDPFFQGAVTLAEGAALVTSGGGWKAAARAGRGAVASFIGTAGGKALIATSIAKHSDTLYDSLTPVELGNLMDMGSLVAASGTCAKSGGCPTVSGEELARLDLEYRQERIAKNSKRSTFEKFFDTESTDSVAARIALNTPTTPKAIMGRVKTVIASITNPVKLNLALGNNSLAIAGTQTAYAADLGVSGEVFGLDGHISVPPNLLNGASSYESVVNWGKDTEKVSQLRSKFAKCEDDSFPDRILAEDKTCDWNEESDGVSLEEKRMFFQYAWYGHVAYTNAILRNKQSNVKGNSGQPVAETTNTPGPIFLIGDSITEGLTSPSLGGALKTDLENAGFKPAVVDASVSRSFSGGGITGNRLSAFAALDLQVNKDAIAASDYVFVGLGTNPLGDVNETTLGNEISQTITKIRAAKPSVKIYWLNVFSPKINQKDARNTILKQQASTNNFTIIDASAASIAIADGIHPNAAGYKTLTGIIMGSLTSGSGASSVSGTRSELNTRLLGNTLLKLGNYQSAEVQRRDIANGIVSDKLVKAMISIVEQAKIALPVNALKSDHSPGSLHEAGQAVDIGYRMGDATGTTLFKFLYDNRVVLDLDELIWKNPPAGYSCLNNGAVVDCVGTFGQGTINNHASHIHAAVKK